MPPPNFLQFMHAVKGGDEVEVRKFITEGQSVFDKDETGELAASLFPDYPFLSALRGLNALHIAAIFAHDEIGKMLLEAAGNRAKELMTPISSDGNFNGYTPIHLVIQIALSGAGQRESLLKYLIRAGADVDGADDVIPPIFLASDYMPSAVKLLCDAGASTDITYGSWPLISHIVSDDHRHGLIPVIANAKNVNMPGMEETRIAGLYPIHILVENGGGWAAIGALARAGANLNISTGTGKRAVDIVLDGCDPHPEVVEALIDNGATIAHITQEQKNNALKKNIHDIHTMRQGWEKKRAFGHAHLWVRLGADISTVMSSTLRLLFQDRGIKGELLSRQADVYAKMHGSGASTEGEVVFPTGLRRRRGGASGGVSTIVVGGDVICTDTLRQPPNKVKTS